MAFVTRYVNSNDIGILERQAAHDRAVLDFRSGFVWISFALTPKTTADAPIGRI